MQLLTLTYPAAAVRVAKKSRGKPKPIDLRRVRLEVEDYQQRVAASRRHLTPAVVADPS